MCLSVCFSKHVHHTERSEHDLALPDLIRAVTSIQKTHFSSPRVCLSVRSGDVDASPYYYDFIFSVFAYLF